MGHRLAARTKAVAGMNIENRSIIELHDWHAALFLFDYSQ